MSALNDFVNAIGAVTEANMVFYEHSIGVGFTPEQALELTKTYMQVMYREAMIEKRSHEHDE